MKLLDKIDFLMRKENINKSTLSKNADIPYSTLDSFYKKGAENMKLSNLIKIKNYFGVSLDYLVDDDIDVFNFTHNMDENSTNKSKHPENYRNESYEEHLESLKEFDEFFKKHLEYKFSPENVYEHAKNNQLLCITMVYLSYCDDEIINSIKKILERLLGDHIYD